MIFVSHVSAHQRMTSEENLKNQVDRMTRPVITSQHLSQPPLPSSNEQGGNGRSDAATWTPTKASPAQQGELLTARALRDEALGRSAESRATAS